MIVDTSAIIPILREEDDAALFVQFIAHPSRGNSRSKLSESTVWTLSNPGLLEVTSSNPLRSGIFLANQEKASGSPDRQAYADFGKGSGHPAGLNFGDCLAYALALDVREPLLWKGDDFGRTGVPSRIGM